MDSLEGDRVRNRAQCKLCGDIIESFHHHDYVTCKCGEISVDGGLAYSKCSAMHWENFLRIDDEGNVIIPVIIEKDIDKVQDIEDKAEFPPPTKAELLVKLGQELEELEKLPSNALINRDQLCYSLLIIKTLFENKE